MDKYLEYIMRCLSNMSYNIEYGGATKEQVNDSMKRLIKEYNEVFGKDVRN